MARSRAALGSTCGPRIVNVMAVGILALKRVDLEQVHLRLPTGSLYSPQKLHAVVQKCGPGLGSVNLYSSGKMLVAGAHSVQQARLALSQMASYAYKVHRTPMHERSLNFRVTNMVGSARLAAKTINIGQLDRKCLETDVETKREADGKRSGLKGKMKKPPVTFIVYNSGNILFNGFAEESAIHEAFQFIEDATSTVQLDKAEAGGRA